MDKEIYISVLKNEIVRLLEENLLLNTLIVQKDRENKELINSQEINKENKDLKSKTNN